jgi:hypothetical protein
MSAPTGNVSGTLPAHEPCSETFPLGRLPLPGQSAK